MRKNYLKLISSYLVVLLATIGCQKEIADPPVKDNLDDAAASENTANKGSKENSCRLVYFEWPTLATQKFHYNDKGLADEWIIDYGDGSPIINNLTYNQHNRLIRSMEQYYGSVYEYKFYYTGKRLTRLTRTNVDFPEDYLDFTYTYNWKGQNTRQDDIVHDQHVLMYYDAFGNCTKTDIYFGSDLVYSDNYTFYAPVRNPLLNVPGVETGFAFYGTGQFADRWVFTSNKTIIYVDGIPNIFNDYNPFKTRIKTGKSRLPASVTYFDRVQELEIVTSYEYDNCGGRSNWEHNRNAQINRGIGINDTAELPRALLARGSAKSIKEELLKMKEQHKSGGK